MAIELKVNLATAVAVAVVELFTYVWYGILQENQGIAGGRFLISAIAFDAGLAVMLQTIISRHWSVRSIEDAVKLALKLTALYACLEGPHVVWGLPSLYKFGFHALHKFLVIFIMTLVFYFMRNSKF